MKIPAIIQHQYYEWSCYLFAIFAVFPQKISSTFCIIWSACFLIKKGEEIYKKKTILDSICKKELIPIWILLLISVISLASAIYAQDSELVISRVFGSRLSLLLIPVASILSKEKINFRLLLKYFIFGNFLFILYSLAIIAYKYIYVQEIELYRDFSSHITLFCSNIIHRSYSSVNILVSFICLFYLFKKGDLNSFEKNMYVFYILLSLPFLMVNNSRAASLSLVILIILGLLYHIKHAKKEILFLLCFMTLGAILLLLPTRTNESIREMIEKKTIVIDDPRLNIWNNSKDIINEHFWLGTGVNNIEKPLIKQYTENNFELGILKKLNTHNQYLGFFMELGIIGLVLFILLLISIPITTKKEIRLFSIPFTVLFVISFFFESMLDRYNGCITFSFFLLWFSSSTTSSNKECALFSNKTFYKTALVISLAIIITFCFCWINSIYSSRKITINNRFESATDYSKKFDFVDKVSKTLVFNNKNSYSHSKDGEIFKYIMIAQCNLSKNESGYFSIKYFISEDYNGNSVFLLAEKDENGQAIPISSSYCDMKKKGTWQEITIRITDIRQTILCYQSTYKQDDASGYILIADPAFKQSNFATLFNK